MRTDKFMMAKAWMKQDQAPQSEARDTWNMMEAEFNDERKATLMANAETDKIKAMMNEKYGPGTIKYGSEIPQPEIKTPQAAFEFSQRNPAAEGGQIIGKPGGVVEPGVMYYGKNVMSGSPAQQLGNQKKTLARFKKIGDAFISQDYNALKTQTRKARIATGAKDAGGILNQFDTKLINDVVFGNDVKAQNALAKNLGTNRKYMMDTWKEALEVTKTGKSKSISKLQLDKLKMQKNIFDEILNNKNVTVKSMAKKFNITEKQVVKESSKLLNNVYMQNVAIGKKGAVNVDSRGYSLIKSWLPDDYKINKNFLDNFSNVKGLKKVQSENIGTLIQDAYGGGKDPKKFTAAMNGLNEYNNLVNSLPEGLKLDLDHPLSKAFLKGSGVSPDQLLNVTPISSNYNRGFKQSLSTAYDKALLADTKDIKKIKQIEKLAKDLGVNIGKGSNKKLDFGATSIAKKTQSGLAEELVKNLNEQNISSTKLNELKKTKEGKKLLKEVFPTGRKLDISQVDNSLIKAISVIACPVKGAKKAEGGRIGFKDGLSATQCFDDSVKMINNGMKGASPAGLRNLAKLGPMLLKAGSAVMSGLIVPEALIVGLETAARVGLGDTPSEAILRATDYLTPDSFFGNFLQKADLMKLERTLGKDVANIAAQSFDRTNQSDKINKLEEKLKNLEAMTESGDFGYVGDLTNQINMTKDQIKQEKNKLKNTTQTGQESKDIFTERALEDSYDASMAKSKFAASQLVNSQSENPRISATQAMQDMKPQEQLNKKQLPQRMLKGSAGEQAFLNLSQLPKGPRQGSEIDDLVTASNANFKSMGSDRRVDSSLLKYVQDLKQKEKDMSIADMVNVYGAESILGTQGNMGQPVERTGPGYMTNYKPLNRFGSQQRPVLYPKGRGKLAEGGITGLRSKYEYKK